MRDVLSGLSLVFASKPVSEAILLTHDAAKCRERVNWMMMEMRPYLVKLQKAPEGRDRDDVIEAYFNQVPAMIVALWRNIVFCAEIA